MGHINNFHLEIIEALRQRGNEVFVMARGEDADFYIPFEKSLYSLKNLKNILKIREILNKERFDAIVLNTNLAAFLVRLSLSNRLKKKIKVVNFVHGYLFHLGCGVVRRKLFLFCEKLVRRKCDVVITMNREDYESAVRHRLAREKIISSMGVGIKKRPLGAARDAIRRGLFGGAPYVIAFVGELSKRKNQRFLIKCLPGIRERLGDVRLCLVGDGDEKERLVSLARRLSVYDVVIFAGYRTDAMDFVNACDLYVSSALGEGMPLNVIEAMSIGKTVLLSRIKGHTDLVSEGDNGYLYDPFCKPEFTEKACRILLSSKIDPERVRASVKGYERDIAAGRIVEILRAEIPGL